MCIRDRGQGVRNDRFGGALARVLRTGCEGHQGGEEYGDKYLFHVFFRFWTLSDFPRRAHRLVDEPVCGLVSDEELLVGIEMQRAVQAQGARAEVHERGACLLYTSRCV